MNIWIIVAIVLVIVYLIHRSGLRALPPHLRYTWHKDYVYPFCMIPRTLTSYVLKQPPKLLIGHKVLDWTAKDYADKKLKGCYDRKQGPNPNQRHVGSWYISLPLYFTMTFNKAGWRLRIGKRWDDIDDYFTAPSFMFSQIDIHEKDEMHVEYKGIAREWNGD